MRCSDLKRAVEDVVLRPDENRLGDLQKRGTIAALDLCESSSAVVGDSMPSSSAATRNTCSCSSEIFGGGGGLMIASTSTTATTTTTTTDSTRPPPPLCASSSLDAIMCRPQPSLIHRHSASGSRRQSRVYATLQSKRKRSNSLTNYNKGQSLSVSLPPSARHTPHRFVNEEESFRNSLVSSDSHSSVARSEDYNNGFVLEEEEVITGCSPPIRSTSNTNPFTTYREPRNNCDDDDMMDCD